MRPVPGGPKKPTISWRAKAGAGAGRRGKKKFELTTKIPVRLSRNRNSEYLPQRRKGRKVRRLRVKIIYKSFCPFPVTLAAWREEFPTPSTFDARLFAQAAQIFNYSNTKATKRSNIYTLRLRALRVLGGKSVFSSWLRLAHAGAIAGFLMTGCTVGPDYLRPKVLIPNDYRGALEPAKAESLADIPWWELFKDPVLQELTREALINNYDLQTAVARVEEARAQIGVARSF